MTVGGSYAVPGQSTPGKPDSTGIVVGIALIVVGIVVGLVVFFASFLGAASQITSARAYPSDGHFYTVDLTSGQPMGIWITSTGLGNCEVDDPSGAPISVSVSGIGNQTVSSFDLVGTFTPSVTGVYKVACQSSGGSFLYKVAPALVPSGTTGIVIGLVIMALGVFSGVTSLVVTGVRRSNWTKQNRPDAMVAGSNWGYVGQPQPQPVMQATMPQPVMQPMTPQLTMQPMAPQPIMQPPYPPQVFYPAQLGYVIQQPQYGVPTYPTQPQFVVQPQFATPPDPPPPQPYAFPPQ